MEIISSVEGMTESTITLLHLSYDEVTYVNVLWFRETNKRTVKRDYCNFGVIKRLG
jgi:hypothetical protein